MGQDGILDKYEFTVVYHLTIRADYGVEIPNQLPHQLSRENIQGLVFQVSPEDKREYDKWFDKWQQAGRLSEGQVRGGLYTKFALPDSTMDGILELSYQNK